MHDQRLGIWALDAQSLKRLLSTRDLHGVDNGCQGLGIGRTSVWVQLTPPGIDEILCCDGFTVGPSSLAAQVKHPGLPIRADLPTTDRKSTRLNSSHLGISYAVFC